MTFLFLITAGALIFIALLILIPPLWRTPAHAVIEDDLDQRNIHIARDRLAELKANKASGGINQIQYDEQVAELELALTEDLELDKPVMSQGVQSQGRWLIYLLMAAVPLLSGGLYALLGNYRAIDLVNDPAQRAGSEQADAGMPSPEAINQMVAKLADKLKKEPNNLEGWMMLGRSYKVMERYQEAVEAYGQAYKLTGEKAEVMLPYAEVLALANKGNWTGSPKELVMKVLAKEPDHPTALWFAAMLNAQQGDKKTAVTFLRKLETVLPPDSPDKQQIHEIIVNTEGQTDAPSVEKSTTTESKATASVSVQVSLNDELRAEVNADDTVFIYAQALSGPKMPLAILRKKVSELPLSVNLSDADAMTPAMKLSNFKEIRLLARISKSGNAMPQAGDLIGTDEQVNLMDNKPHKIVINDRVK